MHAWIAHLLLSFGLFQSAWAQGHLVFHGPCQENPPPDIVTVSFVGDILVHKAIYVSIVEGSKRFSETWKRTLPYLQKADFSVGNLEGPAALGIDGKGKDHGDIGFVYDGEVYSGTRFLFNYHPQILAELAASGMDLLTLANNHILDRGSVGIDRTLQAALQYGIATVGVRASDDSAGDYHKIVEIKNMHIAFIACTEATNGKPDPGHQVRLCERDSGEILNLIHRLSRDGNVDAVVVLPHWGREYQTAPEESQISLAHQFLEAGATAVIGSHPHVLQGWEKYVTQGGRETLIAYSLGNFLAFQAGLEKKTGAILYLGLTKPSKGRALISGVAYTPTYRDGFEIFPLERGGDPQVLKYVARFFGEEGLVGLNVPFAEKFCSPPRTPSGAVFGM